MLTTEQFFANAKAAGMTRPVTWMPSGGGAIQTADVIFRAPTDNVLSGEASSTGYRIEYPASVLVGLKRSEVITVFKDKTDLVGVQYTVRESPNSQLDGTRLEASLRKGT